MFARAARVPPVLVPCRRPLHQQRARLTTSAAADEKLPVPPSVQRTAYVRTWRIPANVTELYTVIREVEKKYGKITTYHLFKDFEDPTRYQLLSYIIFENPESFQRIPEDGVEITVPANPSPKLYYEIGIDDVEASLFHNATQSTSETPVDESGALVFGFKLMRSPMEFRSDRLPRDVIFQNTPYRSMEHFQKWAGFAKLEPLDPPRTIVERELFANLTEIDQNRMRAALQLCSRLFKPVQARQTDTSTAQSASNNSEATSTVQSASNESTSTSTSALMSSETAVPPIKTTAPRSAAQAAADKAKASEQTKKSVEGSKKDSKGKEAAGEIKSTQPSKQKPTGTKLDIPPPAQMPTASQRKKDPKPKIKAVKEFKAKAKPKQEHAVKSKPQPEPEAKSEPEPTKAKGPLAKIWNFFSGS